MRGQIRFLEFKSITIYISDINRAVTCHSYCFAGQADHPLDPVILGLVWGLEYDNITSIGVVTEPVGCLVYNDVFAVVDVGFHAGAIDPEVLYHKMNGEEDDQSQENDLQCFAD